MEDTNEDYDRRVEELEKSAEILREQISPLPTGAAHRALWDGAGKDGRNYDNAIQPPRGFRQRGKPQPAMPLDGWLAEKGLKKGRILGDGKCQYRALSRALFGDDSNHEKLRSLAVEYLRLNKVDFVQDVTAVELTPESLADRGKTGPLTYDGWCDALDLGDEWGNDFTLTAICLLLLVEIRVVTSLRLMGSHNGGPRVMCSNEDPTEKAGAPSTVIYVVLEQNPGAEHYSTLEEDLTRPLPQPRGGHVNDANSHVSYGSGSRHTDYTALDGEDGEGISLGDERITIAQLLSDGVPCGDSQHKYVAEKDNDNCRIIIYKYDMRSGACGPPVRTVPFSYKRGAPKPKSLMGVDVEPLGRRPSDDVENWKIKLAEGPTATYDLAQAMYDSIVTYIERLDLTKGTHDATTAPDRLGTRMYALKDKALAIKSAMFFEAFSPHQDPFKVVVVGVEVRRRISTSS